MEESQEILLNSLQKSGVSVPPDVSSIRNLTPPLLFSICAQVLNRIHAQTKIPFSTSMPDSVADQFKICTEIATAIKDLGYIGDMNFHKVCLTFDLGLCISFFCLLGYKFWWIAIKLFVFEFRWTYKFYCYLWIYSNCVYLARSDFG